MEVGCNVLHVVLCFWIGACVCLCAFSKVGQMCGCQVAHTFSRCSVIGYVALFGDSQEFEADPCVVRQLLKVWTPHLLD